MTYYREMGSQVEGGFELYTDITPYLIEVRRTQWLVILTVTGQWVGEIWNKRKNGEIYPDRLTIGVVRDTAGGVGHPELGAVDQDYYA